MVADDLGLSGSEARSAFFVKTDYDDRVHASISSTYGCCPAPDANELELGEVRPEANLYSLVPQQGWWQRLEDNSVPLRGSPVWVELTFEVSAGAI